MTKLHFNVAGPCVPGDHYMLDPLRGIGADIVRDSVIQRFEYTFELSHKLSSRAEVSEMLFNEQHINLIISIIKSIHELNDCSVYIYNFYE